MKFYIETLGCQMNVNDSDKMAEFLSKNGLERIDNYIDADMVIVNTCSVRFSAEHKAYSLLGRLKEQKDIKPNLIIGVTGCMAQYAAKEIKARCKYVDFVLGAKDFEKFSKIVKRFLPNSQSSIPRSGVIASTRSVRGNPVSLSLNSQPSALSPQPSSVNSQSSIPRSGVIASTRSVRGNPVSLSLSSQPSALSPQPVFKYITIMRGCSNFCSYCIVPYVRGPEQSMDYNVILDEVKKAADSGTKEIILLGQNVNSYNYNGINFTGLLQKISELENVTRIRFMTNHPKDLSDELIDEIAKNKKICRHIHLPLQSGSNNILKAMNRKYTYEQYETLYNKIKNKVPDINITSDIIIGFPGETDEDFEATFNASRKLQFGGLFIFKYSARPNTPAAKMGNQVPLEVIKKRHNILLEDSNIISKKINEKYIDKNIEVLVEKYNAETKTAEARNSQNIKVFFDSDTDLTGQIVNVKITKVLPNSLNGNL